MNVYEYKFEAVGFLPGECDSPEGHDPILRDHRLACGRCFTTGPVAHEWSAPIRRETLVAATVEAVG